MLCGKDSRNKSQERILELGHTGATEFGWFLQLMCTSGSTFAKCLS